MTGVTIDPNDPRLPVARGPDTKPTEQQDVYLVLSEEERKKGYVRPVRYAYLHMGRKVCGQPKTFEDRPGQLFVCVGLPNHEGACGCWTPVTQNEINAVVRTGRLGGCGARTTMGQAIAETYARNPHFYSGTYCVYCRMHRPLNEFEWPDGTQVGS